MFYVGSTSNQTNRMKPQKWWVWKMNLLFRLLGWFGSGDCPTAGSFSIESKNEHPQLHGDRALSDTVCYFLDAWVETSRNKTCLWCPGRFLKRNRLDRLVIGLWFHNPLILQYPNVPLTLHKCFFNLNWFWDLTGIWNIDPTIESGDVSRKHLLLYLF